jgi:hypothetical protein
MGIAFYFAANKLEGAAPIIARDCTRIKSLIVCEDESMRLLRLAYTQQ